MTSTRNRALLISSPIITLMFVAFVLVLTPQQASAAEDAPLSVYGYATDSGGLPVEGADMLVENLDQAVSDQTTTTDEDGFYTVEFPMGDWTEGDLFRTTATYGEEQESDTDNAPSGSVAVLQIDIQFSFAIPEFGSFVGVLVASVLMGALAVYKVRKK